MTRVISLAGNAVTGNNSFYVFTNLQYYARITISCISRKARLSTWLATIYIIVYLCAHANGRILVLNKYTIFRHRRKIKRYQFNLPEIGVGKSSLTQRTNFVI